MGTQKRYLEKGFDKELLTNANNKIQYYMPGKSALSRDIFMKKIFFSLLAEVAQCVISCSGPLTSLIAYDDCR